MNLSFAGCGFLGIYHVGVAVCFKKYAPHLLLDKISGASAGAIAACALLCDLPIGDMTTDVMRVVTEARNRTLGPFSPSFNIQSLLLDGLRKILPEDAHLKVNGKLHISLTRVYDGKNVIVSQFNSKDDLVQALLASSFVPFFSGLLPPRFHGIRYMDGGFSDNLPTLDENTITVSPFCGESDICPRDTSSQLFHVNLANTSIELSRQNIYRFTRILFPPSPETLSNMCQQGFDDALFFLNRNNLINCTRCLAVQTTYAVSDSLNMSRNLEAQCQECKNHQQEALLACLPDAVVTIFQDAIESANKGLMNWVFNHRGMKILSVLSLPYVLPADIMRATFTNMIGNKVDRRSYKIRVVGNALVQQQVHLCGCGAEIQPVHLAEAERLVAAAPELGNNLWKISKFLIQQLAELIGNMNNKSQKISASINCQLAITNFGGTKYDVEASPELPVALKKQMNVNFTLNMESERRTLIRSVQSRRSSSVIGTSDYPLDPDTFEHILKVTSEHDAVMAFYYRDQKNLMQVTEIFDVTNSESNGMMSLEERETNACLEFDEEIEDPTFTSQANAGYDSYSNSMADLSDLSLDDDTNFANVFSDPESEWNNSSNCTALQPLNLSDSSEHSLPESDQQTSETDRPLSRKQSFAILAE